MSRNGWRSLNVSTEPSREDDPRPPEPILAWDDGDDAYWNGRFEKIVGPEKVGAGGPTRGCPFCRESLIHLTMTGMQAFRENALFCGFCGWGRKTFRGGSRYNGVEDSERILRAFDIGDAELSTKELRAAIAARPDRAHDMSPRRMEELVGDVFANAGYRVELTQQTRDGGRDLILVRETDDREAIVEVKRYRRRVGVELVRQLRGVQLRDNVPYAVLVATAGFTSPAHREAEADAPTTLGFTLDLYGLDELLRAMGSLNEPIASPAALSRPRDEYRVWLRDNFGSEAAIPPVDTYKDLRNGAFLGASRQVWNPF